MGWNYIVEVTKDDDLKAAIVAKAEEYRDKYPGVAKEHAIADMPLVEAAADAAVAFVAQFASEGETYRVGVAGSSKHDDYESAAVEVRRISG